LAQEVSEGAQPLVEGAKQTSLDHQLVDGVRHLEQVVKVFGSPVVGIPPERDSYPWFSCVLKPSFSTFHRNRLP
jgi:hypothetical protein